MIRCVNGICRPVADAASVTEADVTRIVNEALADFDPPTGGGDGFAPLVIPTGATFTVPANRQVLYRVPIQVDGELVIDGELIEV